MNNYHNKFKFNRPIYTHILLHIRFLRSWRVDKFPMNMIAETALPMLEMKAEGWKFLMMTVGCPRE